MRATLHLCSSISFLALLFILSPALHAGASAEDFDFDGAAAVQCTCLSPYANNDCLFAGRDKYNYNITLAVRKGFSIDLSDSCFRKRDTAVCCEVASIFVFRVRATPLRRPIIMLTRILATSLIGANIIAAHAATADPQPVKTDGTVITSVDVEDLLTHSLVLLCHFFIHQRALLPQTAGTSGQRGDEPEGELTADACD